VVYCLLLALVLLTGSRWGPRLEHWIAQSPAGMTCKEWANDVDRRRDAVTRVTSDVDEEGLSRAAVEPVVSSQIDMTCAKRAGSYTPVNGDLKAQISAALRRSQAR